MSLRHRFAVYLLILVLVLLAVAGLGRVQTVRMETLIQRRIKLGNELRMISKLHEIVLAQFGIASGILLDSSEVDLTRTKLLVNKAQEQAKKIEALPGTERTLLGLRKWRKENAEYEELFTDLAGRSPISAPLDMKSSLASLRKQAEDQFDVLHEMEEDLRTNLEASHLELESALGSQWAPVLALSLVPLVCSILLLGSFASRLGSAVVALQHAHQRLADGDFKLRLRSASGAQATHDEVSLIEESFDKTAERMERLEEMKSQFYSMAAHDLRSPLQTILYAVYGLENSKKSEEERQAFLGIVQRKVKVILQLVDALLDSFFLKSGPIQLICQKVDANGMLAVCVNDLQPRASERRQRLLVEKLPGESSLWCDTTKVGRVLENLIENAIKYSKEGDDIRIAAREGEHGTVLFQVSDNGPGIPPEEQGKVFEPFHRAAGVKGVIPGRGLGLAICKEFVSAHHGSIWVESKMGIGTSFSFTIPRASGEHQPHT